MPIQPASEPAVTMLPRVFLQLWQGGPRHHEGGVDVVLNHVLEGVYRIVFEHGSGRKYAGVVDQNIQLTEILYG